MAIDTDKMELEVRLSAIEGSALHLHFQQLQQELKETKMKLSHCEIKAKVAGKQEQMHRVTLARIMEAAEKGPVDGEMIADIIRDEHKSSDAVAQVYAAHDGDDHDEGCECDPKNEGDNEKSEGDNQVDDAKEFVRELDLDGKGVNMVRRFQDEGDDDADDDGEDAREDEGDNNDDVGNDDGDNVESEDTEYEDAVTVIEKKVET